MEPNPYQSPQSPPELPTTGKVREVWECGWVSGATAGVTAACAAIILALFSHAYFVRGHPLWECATIGGFGVALCLGVIAAACCPTDDELDIGFELPDTQSPDTGAKT